MNRLSRTVTVLATAALMQATMSAAAHAQWERPRRVDIALGGGATWSSDWSDLVVLGTRGGLLERVLLRDLSVDPSEIGDATFTYWEGRYGFRVHAGFSRSCISVGAGCDLAPLALPVLPDMDPLTGDVDVDSWFLDIGGVVQLVDPETNPWVRPYVTAGFGAVVYDLDDDVRKLLPTFVELGGTRGLLTLPDTTDVVVVLPGDPFLVSVDQPDLETRFAGVLGFGTDLRIPIGRGGFAVRLEATDHIVSSPLDVRLAGLVSDGFIDDDDDGAADIEFDFGAVHNLRFTASVVLEFPLE